jgi:hypothetical protein
MVPLTAPSLRTVHATTGPPAQPPPEGYCADDGDVRAGWPEWGLWGAIRVADLQQPRLCWLEIHPVAMRLADNHDGGHPGPVPRGWVPTRTRPVFLVVVQESPAESPDGVWPD